MMYGYYGAFGSSKKTPALIPSGFKSSADVLSAQEAAIAQALSAVQWTHALAMIDAMPSTSTPLSHSAYLQAKVRVAQMEAKLRDLPGQIRTLKGLTLSPIHPAYNEVQKALKSAALAPGRVLAYKRKLAALAPNAHAPASPIVSNISGASHKISELKSKAIHALAMQDRASLSSAERALRSIPHPRAQKLSRKYQNFLINPQAFAAASADAQAALGIAPEQPQAEIIDPTAQPEATPGVMATLKANPLYLLVPAIGLGLFAYSRRRK